ncbi:hypothetical protein GCM10011376_32600 [Nocardioides flavus (ex Wang et al. 2016)]|uniref:Integral membrane protein n=1 Tax=Nocardioides flavus (ex Wang et al. 2016) TaxID=2058780 RepID=A0ABQ3HLU3_9ACTN|nr:hypothetical protein [Nocardioides flavus (ex Wang et al. 2016)]GHE18650.1 hypothetical protein GCM10011376_32600 [Nocardioides flavus (ex Wang et al. 2016)]
MADVGRREDDLGHSDIEAALAARRELGARYDAELVDGFAERIERAVEQRVAEQVAVAQRQASGSEGAKIRQFVLGIVSVGAGIPITIATTVATDGSGLPAVVVAWLGIAAVNAAHASAVNGPHRREH